VIKILYVSPVADRGGAEAVLLNILKSQDRLVFDPAVCFLQDGELVDDVRRLGVRTFVVRRGRLRNVSATARAIRQLRALIRAENIDVVFSNMTMGHVYGGAAAMGTRTTRMWFQHGIPSLADPLSWIASVIPASIIFVNSRTTAHAQARLPLGGAELRVVDPGVDVEQFAPSPSPTRPLLTKIGIPASSPVVAMVARFQAWKGQDVLLRAAEQVVRERPDVRFVLVGDTRFGIEPDFKQQLHALVHSLGLTAHVVFAGFRDDVASLVNEVDIVVHSHRRPEPFGLAVVEAMLLEKPVIASNLGGPAEVIADGRTGMLIPPEDAGALARAIVTLVADSTKRRDLGRAARAAVSERFTLKRMISEVESACAAH